jgi:phosphopantetheine--protein transferase-like protein
MVYVYWTRCPSGKSGSRQLLSAALDLQGIPAQPLLHDELGRPYFQDGLAVSISHSPGAAAVALSDGPVGVDLEQLRPVRENLPRRVLSAQEYQWFSARGCRVEDFLTLWTLKESFYKYLGTGLPGFPNETQFYLENGQWHLENRTETFWTWQKKDLLIALCGHEQAVTLEEIRLSEENTGSNPPRR